MLLKAILPVSCGETMRRVVASFIMIGCAVSQTAAFQAPGGAPPGKPGVRACALLSRELAIKVSGAVNKLVFDLPPEEEPAGNGTACHYVDITLQIDTFTPDRLEQMRKTAEQEWAPLSGVGDAAYFRNNRNRFAELIGRVGAHSFTIQLGVPFQGSAESMKPNVIALANAIAPKLR